MFSGSIVAMVTPFKNGKIDFDTYKKLIELQIENGTSGIVPCGTTGESPTLSHEEHKEVIEMTVKQVNKRIKIIAGTGSNNTIEAIQLTKFAKSVHSDAVLLVSPYYNRPTQKGLYEHFKTIADQIDIPIILYNIQSRTGVNIEPETIQKLTRECKNIAGVKEASGSLEQMSRIKFLCPKIDLISGDDALTLPLLSIGGSGVISVIANIIPRDVSNFVSYFLGDEIDKARELHYKMLPLTKALFLETNPIPVKTSMGLMKLCSPELRLPLTTMEDSNLNKLKKSLQDYGLL